jgi:protein-S-isoprenylcysteine O-methyltransferase Ste14
MELLPTLKPGLFNGWLLAAILYLVFGVLLMLFPKPVVARLYDRSGQPDRSALRRVGGVLLFLVWLTLAILTPLRPGSPAFVVGLAVYGLGLIGFVVALFNYRSTPLDQPVTAGLYRISRHPQQFTLSVAFLGISIAMGSWPAFALMAIGAIGAHFKVRAEEEACLKEYGEPYRLYMERVPRYFLFF